MCQGWPTQPRHQQYTNTYQPDEIKKKKKKKKATVPTPLLSRESTELASMLKTWRYKNDIGDRTCDFGCNEYYCSIEMLILALVHVFDSILKFNAVAPELA
jgi:hypothetical protein